MSGPLSSRSAAAHRNTTKATYVYQLWGRDKCLYVGMSVNLGGRLSQHKGQHWWRQVERVIADIYPDRETAHVAEVQAIMEHDPAHNTNHTERGLRATQ